MIGFWMSGVFLIPKTTEIFQRVPETLSGRSFPEFPDDLFF